MRLSLFTFAVATAACGPDSTAALVGESHLNSRLGQQEIGNDTADRACQVMLKHAERALGATGFEVNCDTGGACFFVWQVTVDVAAASLTPGAGVYVQYRVADATTWSHAEATAASGAPSGHQRYIARIDAKTVGPGMSATSMNRSRLELLPYLRRADAHGCSTTIASPVILMFTLWLPTTSGPSAKTSVRAACQGNACLGEFRSRLVRAPDGPHRGFGFGDARIRQCAPDLLPRF